MRKDMGEDEQRNRMCKKYLIKILELKNIKYLE